jgi:hypothetical protein
VTTTEHHAKTPSVIAGLFAPLVGLFRAKGSGAPASARAAAAPSRLRLGAAGLGLVLLLAALALPAAAPAAFKYTSLGEIAGPGPFERFESLRSNSVAVNDKNGHIYVADSGLGKVYDFASASDTSPAVWDGSTTPAGEFEGHVSVAVDNSSGDVYVADESHAVIDKFDQDGNLIAGFGDTEVLGVPAHNGQLAGLETPEGSFSPAFAGWGITVDQATHDLYVLDAGHQVIDVFDEGGGYLPAKQIAAEPDVFFSGYADGIGFDGKTGDVFVADSGQVNTYQFDSAGAYLAAWNGNDSPLDPGSRTPAGSFGGYTSVAADDSSGDVFINDTEHQVVDRFDSSGKYLSQIPGVPAGSFGGLAIDQESGDIYVSENENGAVKIFAGTPLVVPDIVTGAATEVHPASALLNGTVNPDEIALTECFFEYGETEAYGETTECEPSAATIGAGNAPVAVEAHLIELKPGATYHFRLSAANANGTEVGADEIFQLPPPPRVDAAAAENLTEHSVDLDAEINPSGFPTTCQIEWGETTEPNNPAVPYEHTEPCTPFELGAGTADVPTTLHLEGVSPETTYHWRVLAENENGATRSFDHTFIFIAQEQVESGCPNEASRTGPSAALPDCRAYELVTPPHKNASLLGDIIFGLLPSFSADGTRLVLPGVQCFASSSSCNVIRNLVGTQFSFQRGEAGWSTTPLGASAGQFPVSTIWLPDANSGYTLFSAPAQPGGQDDFYARAPDSSIAHIGPIGPPEAGPIPAPSALKAHAATPDLSRLVYYQEAGAARWPFDESVVNGFSVKTVYEYAGPADHPFLVAVSGGRESTDLVSKCGAYLGGWYDTSYGAPSELSADGRAAFFTALGGPGCFGAGANGAKEVPANALYARIGGETAQPETVHLSAAQCGSGPGADEVACRNSDPADAAFQGASEDGSLAYFTSTQQLTNEASEDGKAGDSAEANGCIETTGPGGCNLYLYDFNLPLGERLIDVSAGDISGKGPEVQGVIAISADGSHVYFVANGVLAENEGADGSHASPGDCRHADQSLIDTCNLYLYQRDAAHPTDRLTFLATLPAADDEQAGGGREWSHGPRLANVSPDGRILVFASRAALTPDAGPAGVFQVFRYDAQSEELVRVSIGERGFNDNGNSPAFTECGGSSCPAGATIVPSAIVESRRDPTMSDDGSFVYFRSPLALLPGALDQEQIGTSELGGPILAQNLYEWEAQGRGGCTQPQSCVRLISDGRDATSANEASCTQGSAVCLIGTGVSGSDVLFSTADQLIPADTDTQLDFYDARIGGGFAAPAEESICSSSEACHGRGTEEGSQPSPGTPGFSGPEEGANHPRCATGFVKRHGKCIRKHAKKHRKRHHHKRANTNRRAGK